MNYQEQLNQLVGKTFFYKKENVTLEKYKHVSGLYVLFMPGPRNYSECELQELLNEIKPAVETLPTEKQFVIPQEKMVYFEPTKANEDLKNALLDAIKQVKTDKNFIGQAKAIVDISNAVVNIQRAEHDFIKLTKNIK
jgi:hypothetical protein